MTGPRWHVPPGTPGAAWATALEWAAANPLPVAALIAAALAYTLKGL